MYKLLPRSYELAAAYLQLRPEECCMVACHPFDLDAAKKVGFKTAFVRRPLEWGSVPAPESPGVSGVEYDIEVEDFSSLAERLGI